MQTDKRLIHFLKGFVERALLPMIRKFNGSTMEWQKFSTLISQDVLNYGQIQAYVESFPPISSLPTFEKSNTPVFLKKKEELVQEPTSMSSFGNKTFGGESARMALLQKINFDDSSERKEYGYGGNSMNRNSNPVSNIVQMLPTLDRLQKNFTDNQTRMQAIFGGLYDVGYDSKQYH